VRDFVPVIPPVRLRALPQSSSRLETLQWAIQNASAGSFSIIYYYTTNICNVCQLNAQNSERKQSTSLIQNIVLHFRAGKGYYLPYRTICSNYGSEQDLNQLREPFIQAVCEQIQLLILVKPRMEKREDRDIIWME
jgi:hypothetical protein